MVLSPGKLGFAGPADYQLTGQKVKLTMKIYKAAMRLYFVKIETINIRIKSHL